MQTDPLGEFNLQLPRPIQIKKEEEEQQAATVDAQIPQSLFSRVHPPTPRELCRFALSLLSLFFAQCNEDNVEGDGEEDTHTHTDRHKVRDYL